MAYVDNSVSIEAQVIIKEAAATVRNDPTLDVTVVAQGYAVALSAVKETLLDSQPDAPAVTPPAAQAAPAATVNAPPPAGTTIRIIDPGGKAANLGLGAVDFLPAACPKCQGDAVYDNRPDLPVNGGDRNPKSPHFKCAEKSCGEGFWPPK